MNKLLWECLLDKVVDSGGENQLPAAEGSAQPAFAFPRGGHSRDLGELLGTRFPCSTIMCDGRGVSWGTGMGPKSKVVDLFPGAQLAGDSHNDAHSADGGQLPSLLLLGRFKPLIST